jgi:hypothetical protein
MYKEGVLHQSYHSWHAHLWTENISQAMGRACELRNKSFLRYDDDCCRKAPNNFNDLEANITHK